MLAKSKANFVVGLIRLVSKVMRVKSVNFCDHFVQKILQNIAILHDYKHHWMLSIVLQPRQIWQKFDF